MKGSVNMEQAKMDTVKDLSKQILNLEEEIAYREADIKMHSDIIDADNKAIDLYKKKIEVLHNLRDTLI